MNGVFRTCLPASQRGAWPGEGREGRPDLSQNQVRGQRQLPTPVALHLITP